MYMPSFGTIIKKNVLKDFYNKNYYKKLICEYGGEFKAHDYDLFINLAKKEKKIWLFKWKQFVFGAPTKTLNQ